MLLDGERWDLVSMPGAASESITRGVISAPPCSEPSLDAPHGYALFSYFMPSFCRFTASSLLSLPLTITFSLPAVNLSCSGVFP